MRLALASVVSALAAMVTAHTPPDYSQAPEGNAILNPGQDEQVPAGEPYTIKWTPTTGGPISLVLLRGPSNNVKPIDTIAETIENDGSYIWTPSTELEPDVTHYGLMLIVEGTGQYQYSTQFGIKNPGYEGGGGSHSSKPTTTTTATAVTTSGTSSVTKATTETTTETTTDCPVTTSTASATTIPVSVATSSASGSASESSSSAVKPTTMQTSTNVAPSSSASAPGASNTGSGSGSESGIPEPSTTAPSSTPSVPLSTGAANRNALSMGAVAAGAFAVLAF